MNPSSRRKSSSKKRKVPASKPVQQQQQSGNRSRAGTKGASQATTSSQQAPQASASSQQPPDHREHLPSTTSQQQEQPASGRLTPDWFHDKRWASLLALESASRSPSTLHPERPPSTAQQPPATAIQPAPPGLSCSESTDTALQQSQAPLPPTGKLTPVATAAVDEASSPSLPGTQRTKKRRTKPTSVEVPEQLSVIQCGSQQAVAESATGVAQPWSPARLEETALRGQEGTGAERTRTTTPSASTELPDISSRGPYGKAAKLEGNLFPASQTSLTASPPQTTSMSHESTDAEIASVINPIARSSASASLPETSSKSPEGTSPEVARTVTLIASSSAPSSFPETTRFSSESTLDVETTRVATEQAQPSSEGSLPKTTPQSQEGMVVTAAGAQLSAPTSTSETTLQSSEGKRKKFARKRPRSEDDSAVSQRGSEAFVSRSTPSVVRILDDGLTSASRRTESAGATPTVDVGQSTSTQCLPTPLDGRKRQRRRKSEPALPPMSSLPSVYGPALDVTTDSVVSMAVDTGGVSWSTEAKARGLLFTLLHCLSQALLNILIKQVVHIPKTKIAYYVAFGYMLGSMPEAFALKNPFGPRHSQVDIILRGLSSLGSLMLKAEALRYVAVSDLAVAYTMVPVCVMLLSWYFMNEKMGLAMWASVTLCLSGVVVVMRPAIFFKEWDEETSQTRLVGFLYAFGSALSLVIMIVLYRFTRNATTKFLGFNSGLARTIMSLFMMMAAGRFDEVMDGRYMGTLVMMSKLSFCAIFFLNKALQKESGAFVTTVKFSADVIMSVILQIAFLDLYPDAWSMAGILLVALSFMVTTFGNTVKPAWKHRRRRKSIQKRRQSLKIAEEQAIAAMAAAAAAAATATSATSTVGSTDTGVHSGATSGAASDRLPRN
ncbi:hypothetical protein HPB50_016108 [Hyalomma asiaticum]|uniref:Uncharacterized protein n=1 Tax=Hyalomma asiaticum TaxID=266040 RepID=A0ACB7SW07_HYAAI|nr:hypothetical protein HPB50_016108 [Hyalomma asiaticum]